MSETSTDLATIDSPAVVSDVADDLQLVARSPGEMRSAQTALAEWVRQKIEILTRDLNELGNSIDIAVANKWDIKALNRQHALCKRRIAYYAKIQAAIEAGYCVVPNFPLDIFAIRTKRGIPVKDESTSRFAAHRQHSESPPLGEGRNVSDRPEVYRRTIRGPEKEGKPTTTHTYFAHAFEEVEFPIALAKPVVMNAAAEAMALKCFDEIGVLPERRPKGDPVVCGVIYDPRDKYRQKRITFLLAWYLDTKTL